MQTMQLSVVVILSMWCGLVTSTLVVPLVTTTGVTTSATISATTLAAGTAGAALGVAAVGVAALAASRARDSRTSYSRHRREVNDQTLEEVFAVVIRVDSEGCGLRHVCQVFAKPPADLTLRDTAIKRLIGDKPQPASTKKTQTPSAVYQSAAILGGRGEDCHALYRTCTLTPAQVDEYLTNLDISL